MIQPTTNMFHQSNFWKKEFLLPLEGLFTLQVFPWQKKLRDSDVHPQCIPILRAYRILILRIPFGETRTQPCVRLTCQFVSSSFKFQSRGIRGNCSSMIGRDLFWKFFILSFFSLFSENHHWDKTRQFSLVSDITNKYLCLKRGWMCKIKLEGCIRGSARKRKRKSYKNSSKSKIAEYNTKFRNFSLPNMIECKIKRRFRNKASK